MTETQPGQRQADKVYLLRLLSLAEALSLESCSTDFCGNSRAGLGASNHGRGQFPPGV